jgi:RNA polymerase sigma-70 factor (ECF subfamily)
MVDAQRLDDWFLSEVMPLEPALMRFLRRNWRNGSEVADLRQELYVKLYDSGREALPTQTRAFVFRAARNLLINRALREQVVSIELVADLEALNVAEATAGPERQVAARDELRRLQVGLDRLPPRCREVVVLRRIEGLSQREVAGRLGVGEDTVEKQMVYGMRALIDFMLGGSGKIRRGPAPRAAKAGEL